MLPAAQRCVAIRPLIDEGLYFVLHAPRQTGKTTLVRNYARELPAEGKYAAVALSIECFTENEVESMLPQMLRLFAEAASQQLSWASVAVDEDRRRCGHRVLWAEIPPREGVGSHLG
ncbi:MAG: hypothetical protein AUK47_25240 [Deltaproteobacteria bacterium CG2_30_63_29]|nr:MAG: hypothetical protein AUK47_25240 [Deltaproteobacteria bacterium CG2_30_63_29]PJB40270.1 MAG: hypothetical protein CO108_15160 [Deltaproteobacteria bacterium CG_4_9_14_3_um_filter_63_12]